MVGLTRYTVNQAGVKSVSKILKNILVRSGALAIATLVLVGLAGDALPYSRTRDRITDALASPGARIAGLIYPQGVHTGTGARFWGIAALACNLVAYLVFWFACLKLASYLFARRHRYEPTGLPARRIFR
jgi:hypothetical protein